MKIKTFVICSQVVMTEDGLLYYKNRFGSETYWSELTPVITDGLGYARLYKIRLKGKKSAYSRYFFVAKYSKLEGDEDYWKLVIDFVDRSEMRCFLFNYSLFVIGYANKIYDLGNSYIWNDTISSPKYPCYTKVSSELPAIKVKEEHFAVLEQGCLVYWHCKKVYSQAWSENGYFEKISSTDAKAYSALPG